MTINAIIKTIIVLSMMCSLAVQDCPQPHLAEYLDEGGCEEKCDPNKGGKNGNPKPQEEEEYKTCGQYGFRCVDLKTFVICPGPNLDDDYPIKVEEPQEHICGDGLICDEDNPAYCSPVDATMTTARQTKEEPLQNWAEDVYINDYMDKVQKLSDYNDEYNLRMVRSLEEEKKHDDCGCSSYPTTEMSTVMTTTTLRPEPSPPSSGPYECEGYGFHADNGNNTLFWYCDVPESGTGYIVKHMSCGEDRVFDASLNTCVKIGTTRNIRNQGEGENIVEHRCAPSTPPPPPTPFSCKNFPPGKYKDENDCSLYHICFSNKYFPLKEVTISCPHNMAFDAFMKKCTHRNNKRCPKPTSCTTPIPSPACTSSTKCSRPHTTKCRKSTTKCTKKPSKCTKPSPTCPSNTPCGSCGSKINCESPIRFRDVSDCGGYFLCYSDNVIHMKCPESFKFDDSYHDCMPNRIARCTEEM